MIQIIYKCGEEIVNKHSDGGRIYGWENPFCGIMPNIGDYIELGEHTEDFKHLPYTPMKRYVVKSRTFSSVETYNHSYFKSKCIIEVEEIKD